MTRTSSQLAKTGVRNPPPVYFCRQCIAVRVFEEGGVCPTCVNVEADSIRMAEVRDKRIGHGSRACADDDAHSRLLRASDAANRREIRNEMIDKRNPAKVTNEEERAVLLQPRIQHINKMYCPKCNSERSDVTDTRPNGADGPHRWRRREDARIRLSGFEWTLVWAAFRHFLGRQTAASACFPEELMRSDLFKRMTERQRKALARDIREHKEAAGCIGNPQIDEPYWMRLLTELEKESSAGRKGDG